MPIIPSPYIQYGGVWTTSQATDAVASGTWAVPPTPKIYAWGNNGQGQLGTGNTTQYSSPVQVGALTGWSSISSSQRSTSAIKTNGTLWSWGGNNNGLLGLGNTIAYSSPKQVGSLTTWGKISSGSIFMTALKTP